MGALMLVGLIMLGYSLPMALFFLVFLRKSQLIIVMLAASFFWLMAMTLTSLIWSAIPQLHQSGAGGGIVPVGVVFVELARMLFVRLYYRCERSFSVVSINAIVFPLVDFWSALAAGVGFGATHTLIYYAPMIGFSMEAGTLFTSQCSVMSSFTAAAANACLFNALHLPLMILAFDAYRRVNLLHISAVWLLHAAAAGLTLLNQLHDGCRLAVPLVGAVVLIAYAWCAVITHKDDYRSNKVRRVHHA